MKTIEHLEKNHAYRWVVALGAIGGLLEVVGWVLRTLYSMNYSSIGIALEGAGTAMILITLLLTLMRLGVVLKGHEGLVIKNLELIKKAEQLERELKGAQYHLDETQERVSKLLEETRTYFDFAADVQTYRAEGAMMGNWQFRDEEARGKHIAKEKFKEWSDLDKHFEKAYPMMSPVIRRKNMEKVLGYAVEA